MMEVAEISLIAFATGFWAFRTWCFKDPRRRHFKRQIQWSRTFWFHAAYVSLLDALLLFLLGGGGQLMGLGVTAGRGSWLAAVLVPLALHQIAELRKLSPGLNNILLQYRDVWDDSEESIERLIDRICRQVALETTHSIEHDTSLLTNLYHQAVLAFTRKEPRWRVIRRFKARAHRFLEEGNAYALIYSIIEEFGPSFLDGFMPARVEQHIPLLEP